MGVGEGCVSTALELNMCFEVVCLEGLQEPLYGCRYEVGLCLDRSRAQNPSVFGAVAQRKIGPSMGHCGVCARKREGKSRRPVARLSCVPQVEEWHMLQAWRSCRGKDSSAL